MKWTTSRPSRKALAWLRLAALAGLACAPAGRALAGPCTTTRAAILDVILGARALQPAERPDFDLNSDDVVDVLDIAALRLMQTGAVRATFREVEQSLGEGAGQAFVDVDFTPPLCGTFLFSVGASTATPGQDFTSPLTAVNASGHSVRFSVAITNDAVENEEIEWVTLQMEKGPFYGYGDFTEHRIVLIDDDLPWHGVLERDGGRVPIQLQASITPGQRRMRVVSDGSGVYPAGEYDLDIATWTTGETGVFDASTAASGPEAIVTSTSSSAFGAEMTRQLRIQASSAADGQEVTDELVVGSLTETVVAAPGYEHLNRTVTYGFGMSRGIPRPSTAEAPLQDEGACCVPGEPCQQSIASACSAAGGTFFGAGVSCVGITCQ